MHEQTRYDIDITTHSVLSPMGSYGLARHATDLQLSHERECEAHVASMECAHWLPAPWPVNIWMNPSPRSSVMISSPYTILLYWIYSFTTGKMGVKQSWFSAQHRWYDHPDFTGTLGTSTEKFDQSLVGGWPTPLKNMTSSVGIMKFPIYGKIKHVPNHQPKQLTGHGQVIWTSPIWTFSWGYEFFCCWSSSHCRPRVNNYCSE